MNQKLNIANKLLEERLIGAAKEVYKEVYANERDPEALLGLALCARQENDIVTALRHINTLISINPNHAGAYNQAGIISVEMGDFEAAKTMFIAAIEKDPTFVDAQRNYAEVLLELEDYENGVRTFMRILENHPDDVPTLLRVAQLYEEVERFDDATQYANKALEYDPQNVMAKDIIESIRKKQNGTEMKVGVMK